jgi:HPt (histidine-containing phosphotransfer) domain-containing protein
MTELRDALRAGDASRLREAAHRLCGLASAFSTATADAASALEDIADRGELERAASLVEQLEGMLRQLRDEVHDLTREGVVEPHP